MFIIFLKDDYLPRPSYLISGNRPLFPFRLCLCLLPSGYGRLHRPSLQSGRMGLTVFTTTPIHLECFDATKSRYLFIRLIFFVRRIFLFFENLNQLVSYIATISRRICENRLLHLQDIEVTSLKCKSFDS